MIIYQGMPEGLLPHNDPVRGDWEERMSLKARLRAQARYDEEHKNDVKLPPAEESTPPTVLHAVLPEGESDDEPREWCSDCGRTDLPQRESIYEPIDPCPDCGSRWRWTGRIADLNGTATGPPPNECLECWDWQPFGPIQAHFGWRWLLKCGHCSHEHHKGEVWIG